MDTAYSLSDLASVMGNGEFGGNSAWLIILFVLIFGWGGFNRNNNGELNQYATAASQQDILFNQKFDAIGQKLNSIGDGIASLGYSQLQQMDNNTSSINGNIVNEGRSLQTQLANCCCSVKEAVHAEGEATRAMISQNKIESLQAQVNTLQNQQAIQNAMCGVPKINPYMYGIVPQYNGCGCNGNI